MEILKLNNENYNPLKITSVGTKVRSMFFCILFPFIGLQYKVLNGTSIPGSAVFDRSSLVSASPLAFISPSVDPWLSFLQSGKTTVFLTGESQTVC